MKYFFPAGVLIFISVLALFVYVIKTDSDRYNRLLTQCISDGHKEYECMGILRRVTE